MANIFPKWSNGLPLKIITGITVTVVVIITLITYYFTPKYSNVGYKPVQPVAFSHYLHAEQLGIDCRYCHTYVDRSGHSNVPSANTCMNCHSLIHTDSPRLAPIRESYETGTPVPWVWIHKVPEYVYFNHAVHVNRGISCIECHGEINKMEVVYQSKPLTMRFCLDCHRNPESRLRPNEEVFNLNWKADNKAAQLDMGKQFVHDWRIAPPQSCSGCHR